MSIKVLSTIDKYFDRVYLLSDIEPFEQYQFFKILDENNKNPICKVIRPHSIKKLGDIDSSSVYKNAISLGFNPEEKFYWAEVLIEKELTYSIDPEAEAIIASETEMYSFLYSAQVDDSLILGEIRGTENLYKTLKNNKYRDILMMAKDWELTNQSCLPLLFEYKKLQQNPNIGIFGNSGSGKTFTLKSLIEEGIKNKIPMIVFDPHNEFDFSSFMDTLPKHLEFDIENRLEYLTAGKDFALDFTNLTNEDFKFFMKNVTTLSDPQELAIDEIRTNSVDGFETFRENVDKIARALQKREINRTLSADEITADEERLIFKYGGKISNSSVLIALSSKLASFSRKGFFTKDYENIVNSLRDKKTVIVRGEHNIVAPMMGLIISDLWRKRKDFKDEIIEEEYPPMIIALDESHIYAPKDMNIKAPLRQSLRDISREGRKYGMFLICATQRISELDNTVLSQMSTKIILKTSQESDKQIIQKECGLNDTENNRLHLLDSGHGYIISPILKTKTALAFKSRSNYTKPKSTINVFDELLTLKSSGLKDDLREYLKLQTPFKVRELPDIVSNYSTYSGKNKDMNEIKKVIEEMVEEGLLIKNGMGIKMEWFLPN